MTVLRTSHTMMVKKSNFDFLDEICWRSVFSVEKRTNKLYHRIQYIWISLGTKCYPNQTDGICPKRERLFQNTKSEQNHQIDFLDQVYLKIVFTVQSRASEHYHQIHILELVQAPSFILRRKYWLSRKNLPKSCISFPKQDK